MSFPIQDGKNMAKVIIVPNGTQVVNENVIMNYSASVIGPLNFSYGSDYQININMPIAANITTWKNKIIAEVGSMGVTIIGADIITFGSAS